MKNDALYTSPVGKVVLVIDETVFDYSTRIVKRTEDGLYQVEAIDPNGLEENEVFEDLFPATVAGYVAAVERAAANLKSGARAILAIEDGEEMPS